MFVCHHPAIPVVAPERVAVAVWVFILLGRIGLWVYDAASISGDLGCVFQCAGVEWNVLVAAPFYISR